MTTPTFVMAVPWEPARSRRAVELHHQTGATIVWDTEHSIQETWLATLAQAGDGPAIMLQDDIAVTGDWRRKIEEVIATHSDDVIQFFSLRLRDSELGSRWMPARTFLMAQCFYLPAHASASLRRWIVEYGQSGHPEIVGVDSFTPLWMSQRLTAAERRYWLHVPSLVQHEPWRSAVDSRRSSGRQSKSFTP